MLERRADEGLPTPAIDNRPILLPGLDFYFTAYNELRYDRPIGMALGPIPWSSVVKWGEIHGIHDPDDLAVLETHIRAMESVMAKFEAERNSGKGGKT